MIGQIVYAAERVLSASRENLKNESAPAFTTDADLDRTENSGRDFPDRLVVDRSSTSNAKAQRSGRYRQALPGVGNANQDVTRPIL